MKKKYCGIIPPIITPVDANEQIDEQGFRALIERCVQGGLHGIFVAGTNGECMQLTQQQRNRAIAIAIDQVAGRIPVLCGVMDSSTRRVIDNVKALEQMGGTCAVVTSIFYARHTSQEESIGHMEAISAATQIDLVLYNMPSMTGLSFAPATVLRIAQIDKVMGYKDSSTDYGGFLQILERHREGPFACLQGVTAQAMSALLMGADGYVPALAPLFPQLFARSYEIGRSGNVALARQYNQLIAESSKILGLAGNMTAAAKYAISTLGLTDKRVLAPQQGTTAQEESKIDRQIERVNQLHAQLKECAP